MNEAKPINAINPNGRYPLCMPVVGDLASTCERCGDYAGYNRPCPAVPRNRRWGPDYVPPDDEQPAESEGE